MGKDSSDLLARVSRLDVGDSSHTIYDDWSPDYDHHLLGEFGYISPEVAARALAEVCIRQDIEIIDFACGTGLVGSALRAQGFGAVDGIDISAGMLAQAEQKGAYRQLIRGDLTTRIELDDARYDAGLCIGSMGAGHIGPEHIPELLRPIKRSGWFVIVVNGMHFTPEGFDLAFRQIQHRDLWQIYRCQEFNYMTELDRPGWLLVARRC